MNKAFFQEGLQGAIDSDPVEFFACAFFNVAVCECAFLLQEKLKDLFPAAGDAELIAFEYIFNFIFHDDLVIPDYY